ncbi:hypothetical protein HK102_011043, partial [Quaeritorhiza haematococci]
MAPKSRTIGTQTDSVTYGHPPYPLVFCGASFIKNVTVVTNPVDKLTPTDKLIEQLCRKDFPVRLFIEHIKQIRSLRDKQTLTISMHTSYHATSTLKQVLQSLAQSETLSNAVQIDYHLQYYSAA